jgi:hypothetical protein
MDHDRRAWSRAQAWLDDNPVERMKAITNRLGGIPRDVIP